ncbi:MAG: ABC transporter permease [Lachnospiraceae bacterium]|nr:ABC transporter permease [Lachnospiraceae bacterium]
MNLSLLLGCVLFVATAVSFPLYQKTAYDRMLQDELSLYIRNNGKWPLVLKMSASCRKDDRDTIGKMERFTDEIYDLLDVPPYMTILSYTMQRETVTSDIKREDTGTLDLSLSAMTGLSEHAVLSSGSLYSEDGLDDTGAIEVIIPQATLVQKGLLPDETLTFDDLTTPDGKPVRIHIIGVFTGGDNEDFYFQDDPDTWLSHCFMEPALFRSLFTGEHASLYTIMISFYDLPDYRSVSSSDVRRIRETTAWLCRDSAFQSVLKEPEYRSILEEYAQKQMRISATLMILQIPVLVLLAAFLLMISGQMYEMERNEISVIKSRGSSRGQILLLYLYQGAFLSLLGAVLGVPLAALFARLLSSTRNFLEFHPDVSLPVHYSLSSALYAAAAVLVTLLSISLPAIRHSRVTIVNLKQQKAVGRKPLWQKLFIDIVFIGVALYGFYTFRRSMGSISETVLSGERLDPLLYISSSLFIVGTGLFFLRIQPLIVKLIYLCVRKICGPAGYISFMENTKNGHKLQLIMLFLIMTISLGMFHATVARTILENAVENTTYLDGTDVIIKENWPMLQDENGTPTGTYLEPDPTRYLSMDFADSHTRVLYDDKAYMKQKKNARVPLTFMAVHTREFGEMTSLPAGINEKSWHTYLNELAVTEQGLLVSRNFETVQDVAIGDTISFFNGDGKALKGTVVDFVDYFPSYRPSVTVINPDGSAVTEENYLIVANYADIRKKLGLQPYEEWISLTEDATPGDVYDFITGHDMTVRKYINRETDVEHTMTDPLLQGTNGILTMGFAVTLLLCAVGYLIYWIMSIKERELVFGVLRACGFHKGEIVRMLLMEQLFSGVFSVLAGIGIGKLTSMMFVPMLQASYATSDQVLPMKLITRASDLYKLYGIVGGVMLLCVFVLIFLLFGMNVTKALKLGEE